MNWYYFLLLAQQEKVEFQGQLYTVQVTDEAASEHFDYVLMSAGGSTRALCSTI